MLVWMATRKGGVKLRKARRYPSGSEWSYSAKKKLTGFFIFAELGGSENC